LGENRKLSVLTFRKFAQYVLPICLASLPALANTGSNVWYVTPEDRGACGEECYTAPTAWIDDAYNRHSFGISCGGTMKMAGPAMEASVPPFSHAEMYVDQQSYGIFEVQNGLNDTVLSPTNPSWQTPTRTQAALNAGESLSFVIPGYAQLDFTLSGSRSAISLMNSSCSY
jgi:hypothetical protein